MTLQRGSRCQRSLIIITDNVMKNEELRIKNYFAARLYSAAKFFILHP